MDTTPTPPALSSLPVIPKGAVTVDGDISEWAGATWMDANRPYSYHPELTESQMESNIGFGWLFVDTDANMAQDIINSQFAVRWDDNTGKLYMAAVIEDTNQFFTNAYSLLGCQ